jgi:hypothetical protein
VIANRIPEVMVGTRHGDRFIIDTTSTPGPGCWSLQSTYHLLGGLNPQTPNFLASQR